MAINMTVQKFNTETQKYSFCLGKDKWVISYHIFTYHPEYDKPLKAMNKSLIIKIKSPIKILERNNSYSEEIYEYNSEVELGSLIPFSPVLKRINHLNSEDTQEIFDFLRPGARNLLERGLEKYAEIRKSR